MDAYPNHEGLQDTNLTPEGNSGRSLPNSEDKVQRPSKYSKSGQIMKDGQVSNKKDVNSRQTVNLERTSSKEKNDRTIPEQDFEEKVTIQADEKHENLSESKDPNLTEQKERMLESNNNISRSPRISRQGSLYIDVCPEDAKKTDRVFRSTRFSTVGKLGTIQEGNANKGIPNDDTRGVVIMLEILDRHSIRALSIFTWLLFFFATIFTFFEIGLLQNEQYLFNSNVETSTTSLLYYTHSVSLQQLDSNLTSWNSGKIQIHRLNFLMRLVSDARTTIRSSNPPANANTAIGVRVEILDGDNTIWERGKTIYQNSDDILDDGHIFAVFDTNEDEFGKWWQQSILEQISKNSKRQDKDENIFMRIQIQYNSTMGLNSNGDFTEFGVDRRYRLTYNTIDYRIFDIVLRNLLLVISLVWIILWLTAVLAIEHKWISEQYWISILLVSLFFYQGPFITPLYMVENSRELVLASALSFSIPEAYMRTFWLLMADAVRVSNHGQYSRSVATDEDMIRGRNLTNSDDDFIGNAVKNVTGLYNKIPKTLRERINKIHAYALGRPRDTHSLGFYKWKIVLFLVDVTATTGVTITALQEREGISAGSVGAVIQFSGTFFGVMGIITLAVWVLWFFSSLYRSRKHLSKLPYLQTRFRQISFRDFANKTYLVIAYFFIIGIQLLVRLSTTPAVEFDRVDYRVRTYTASLVLVSGYIYIIAFGYIPVRKALLRGRLLKRNHSFFGYKQFLPGFFNFASPRSRNLSPTSKAISKPKLKTSGNSIMDFNNYSGGFRLDWARWLTDLAWQAYMDLPGVENSEWGTMDLGQFGFKLLHFQNGKQLATGTRWYLAKHKHTDTLVISFRGSATKMDLRTNIKFQMTPLPDEFFRIARLTEDEKKQDEKQTKLEKFAKRFNNLLHKAKPVGRVHVGFYKAWLSVRDEVLHCIQAESKKMKTKPIVFCTGHSLGGALATFCAYEARAKLHADVHMYNYGSPRVGNHEFRAAFNTMVPNSFRIIYDRDIVPTVPDSFFWCCCLYRHVGRAVIVDGNGNLVCDPSHIERAMRRSRAISVNDHFLPQYYTGINLACVTYGLGYRRPFWLEREAEAKVYERKDSHTVRQIIEDQPRQIDIAPPIDRIKTPVPQGRSSSPVRGLSTADTQPGELEDSKAQPKIIMPGANSGEDAHTLFGLLVPGLPRFSARRVDISAIFTKKTENVNEHKNHGKEMEIVDADAKRAPIKVFEPSAVTHGELGIHLKRRSHSITADPVDTEAKQLDVKIMV